MQCKYLSIQSMPLDEALGKARRFQAFEDDPADPEPEVTSGEPDATEAACDDDTPDDHEYSPRESGGDIDTVGEGDVEIEGGGDAAAAWSHIFPSMASSA